MSEGSVSPRMLQQQCIELLNYSTPDASHFQVVVCLPILFLDVLNYSHVQRVHGPLRLLSQCQWQLIQLYATHVTSGQ